MNRGARKRREKAQRKAERKLDRKIASRIARDRREGNLRLTRFALDRSVFDGMTTEEKVLLVQLGQLANELNTNALTQLGWWSFNGTESFEGTNTPEQAVRFARFAQAPFILRLLASRLWEGR
jgi:hypothetical protein